MSHTVTRLNQINYLDNKTKSIDAINYDNLSAEPKLSFATPLCPRKRLIGIQILQIC